MNVHILLTNLMLAPYMTPLYNNIEQEAYEMSQWEKLIRRILSLSNIVESAVSDNENN